MKRTQKRRSTALKSTSETAGGIDPHQNPHAAGIDIGARELVAAVPPQSTTGPAGRTFTSFTAEVEVLRDWLLSCGVRTVAMESPGNYWITAYDLLEESGIEVCLVNARHVKGMPGRRTDVQDAAWLQQLHAAGLLRKSFRPAQDIVSLRYLMRYRQNLVNAASQQIQAMQKVMTEPERSGDRQRSFFLQLLAKEFENPARLQRRGRGERPSHHHRHPRGRA